MSNAIKIVFMGSPEFAVPTLRALYQNRYVIQAVYSQPAKPAGRGQKETPTAVAQFAIDHGLDLFTPNSLKESIEHLRELAPDLIVVVAYGLILPQSILDIPKFGCINIHGSILPRFRGAAPIQHAFLAGDMQTGITIIKMDAGMDTGDIMKIATLAITTEDNVQSMANKLAYLGARSILDILPIYCLGRLIPEPQPSNGVSYAPKIKKTDAELSWLKSALELQHMVQGYSAWPVAFFTHNNIIYKVHKAFAEDIAHNFKPGTHLGNLRIACSKGILQILQIQLPGGKILTTENFLRGHQFPDDVASS